MDKAPQAPGTGGKSPRAIENIVFDMGGVLMGFDGMKFSRIFTSCEEDALLLFDAVFNRVEWSLLDAGVISHETLRRVARARLPERLYPALDECLAHWPEHSLPIPETNDLVARLKARGLGIYLLSNASTHIEQQLNHMPADAYMDGRMVSAFERIMKPDPEIFDLLCKRYGLDPATCLFVDDNADNCAGARVAGMRAFHFTGDVAALEHAIDELSGSSDESR